MKRTMFVLVALGASMTAAAAPPTQSTQNVNVVNSTTNPVPVVMTNGGGAAAVNVHHIVNMLELAGGRYSATIYTNSGSTPTVLMTLSATQLVLHVGSFSCDSATEKPSFAQFRVASTDDYIAALIFTPMNLVGASATSGGDTLCRYVAMAPSPLVVGIGQKLFIEVTSDVGGVEASFSASGYTLR